MAQPKITPSSVVGILCNPHSRKGKAWLAKQLKTCTEGTYLLEVTPNIAAIPQALALFAEKGIHHLAIIGGDGTLDAVITALKIHQPFKEMPVLAAFAAGTTNMSHKDIGFKPKKNALNTFIKACLTSSVKTRQKHPLKIETTFNPPLYGFFIGTSAIPRVIHKTRAQLHTKGLTSTLSEALSLIATLWQLLKANSSKTPLLQPEEICLTIQAPIQKQCVFLAITSLDTLLLKISPCHTKHSGFSVLGVTAPYKNFLTNIWAVLRQKPFPLTTAETGYINTHTQKLVLNLKEEWTLDGEMFPAKGPLHITLGTPLTFAIGVQ